MNKVSTAFYMCFCGEDYIRVVARSTHGLHRSMLSREALLRYLNDLDITWSGEKDEFKKPM